MRIAFFGTYVPRRCGIGTFAADLCHALTALPQKPFCSVVAINDHHAEYPYPDEVHFEIDQENAAAYRRAADFVNSNEIDVISLQHEYGIFGGPEGQHVLEFLNGVRVPVVSTLHTILKDPPRARRSVIESIAQRSDRLVVMSPMGGRFLRERYNVPVERIRCIPHGIPDAPFGDPNFFKDRFGLSGRFVILTFGLLGPNKGLEYVIEALPKVVARYPQVVYMIVGETAKFWLDREGEAYRLRMMELSRQLGVEKHVIFHRDFLPLPQLLEYLGAADIYITPYPGEEQITSGTLSYALGLGKAVISTPYFYAKELLNSDRGILVPFSDSSAIADQIVELIQNEPRRHALRKQAYLFGRYMIWPVVAASYFRVFDEARQSHFQYVQIRESIHFPVYEEAKFPQTCLHHLRALCTETGILRKAIDSIPDWSSGFATDDQARALLIFSLIKSDDNVTETDLNRHLSFLWNAYDARRNAFRGLLSFQHRWRDLGPAEETTARVLWALGALIGRRNHPAALRLFGRILPSCLRFASGPALSFAVIAIQEYLRRFSEDSRARRARRILAEKLFALYQQNVSGDWFWFGDALLQENGRLPQALLMAGFWTGRQDWLRAGLSSLEWLVRIETAPEGWFRPVGTKGYSRNGMQSRFDQLPAEAESIIGACMEAHRITGEERWIDGARNAFMWFLGKNDLGIPLYNERTKGCSDQLSPSRVSPHQGPQGTLAFVLSQIEMQYAPALAVAAAG